MKTRLITLLLGCTLLAACASGPAYRPAVRADDFGYRDTMLTSDRFRVSFSGDYAMARESVETFALFRAADVALAHGATHFRINSRETSPVTSNGGGPSTSIGYGYGYPFFGTGIGYSSGGYSRTRYETVLEIQIGPDIPDSGPEIYDANELKRNLSPSVASTQD
ncbi:CC0125/CC1285 family lipoprotein [Salinisphaera aquimarina]|uniref:DUF4136 domain-containing protein n=1 Tax=Salinisphaera aquimarina TaxID=2094031 RepID=A0ABV7EQA6_9GAMM